MDTTSEVTGPQEAAGSAHEPTVVDQNNCCAVCRFRPEDARRIGKCQNPRSPNFEGLVWIFVDVWPLFTRRADA